MPPFLGKIVPRSTNFNPGIPSGEFSDQWRHPGDVFSVLLILGGDVVGRALAQFAGGFPGSPSFSFGWVAYSINALVSAVGENKLMPPPDCQCVVINGKSGYSRANSSWILGRMVRDYESWMHRDIDVKVNQVIDEKWKDMKDEARAAGEAEPQRPKQVGLCVSVYVPISGVKAGEPVYDIAYVSGFIVAFCQLGLASVPCGLYGDWGILLITVCGIILSIVTASLPQWKKEKWACRRIAPKVEKKVIVTRGNGSQHAIVILGNEGFLDLEDLAGGQANVDFLLSNTTRVAVATLALFWILLLITAAGLKQNTWFLLAVGGIGILQNVLVAGWRRNPRALGIPIKFDRVLADKKVMKALYAVEEAYPRLGRSMLDTFFPGKLRADEEKSWDDYGKKAKELEIAVTASASNISTSGAPANNFAITNGPTTSTATHNALDPNNRPENPFT